MGPLEIDFSLIGITAAATMESIPEDYATTTGVEDLTIKRVLVLVEITDERGATSMYYRCSDTDPTVEAGMLIRGLVLAYGDGEEDED